MSDDVTIVPTAQIRAMMDLLSARKIQEDRGLILNTDPERYLTGRNFLHYLGLKQESPLFRFIMDYRADVGLSKAVLNMPPDLRFQMITAEEAQRTYAVIDPKQYNKPKGDEDGE